MRAIIVLLAGVVLCSICSCMQPSPNDKYPFGREEIKEEHLEAYEDMDR